MQVASLANDLSQACGLGLINRDWLFDSAPCHWIEMDSDAKDCKEQRHVSKVDKYMPLWIGDYLADTTHLSTVQHGAYLLLIMAYWRKGPLRNDDATLAATAKMTAAEWRKHKLVILAFFTLNDGQFTQTRIEKELVRAGEVRKKAKAAADARWHANGMQDGCSNDADASPKHMPGASPLPSPLPSSVFTKKTTPRKPPTPAGIEKRKNQFDADIAALVAKGIQ
jgi:uncharacterized protein YdaU (DUF1376 family)